MAFPDILPSVVVDANTSRLGYPGGPNFLLRNPANGHLFTWAYQFPRGNRTTRFYRSSDGGLTWNSPRDFTNMNHELDNRRICLMIDRNSRIHALYCSNNPGYLFTHRYSDDEFTTESVETSGLPLVDVIQGVCSPNNDDRFVRINGTWPTLRYFQTFQDGSFGAPSVSFTEGYAPNPWIVEMCNMFNDIHDRKIHAYFENSTDGIVHFTRSTVPSPLAPADLGVPVIAWTPPSGAADYYIVPSIDRLTNYMVIPVRWYPGDGTVRIRIIVSLDDGATWLDRGDFPGGTFVPANVYEGFLRAVAYYHNSIIYIYLRENGASPRIVCRYSLDHGITWSAAIVVVPNSSGYVMATTMLGGLNDPNLSYPAGRFPIVWQEEEDGAEGIVRTFFNAGVSEYGSSAARKIMCDVTGAFTRQDPFPSINQIKGTGQSRRY